MDDTTGTVSSTSHISEYLIERQNCIDEQRKPRSLLCQPSTPPKHLMGLLTRTVAHSPITRYIFSASLWDREHRDAIFVGENYVSIKAYIHDPSNSGHLEDVVTKFDFGGARILSAKVLELPSNRILDPSESLPDENDCPTATDGWSLHMLCLALSSSEILYLRGDVRDGPRSTFITARKVLPDNVSRLEQYGQHMAVDPLSRAMAISAAQNFFGIMNMRSYDEIEAGVAQKTLQPIREERFFRVEGTILAMDFLFPPRRDHNLIILVLLVFGQQHVLTHQTLTWNITQGLQSVSTTSRELVAYPTGFYEPIPAAPVPIMLIPVTLPTSYLIATPTKAVIYRDVLSDLPPVANELAPPSSRWVAWARPQRTEKWDMQHDDVYVCTDDGQLLLLSMNHEGQFTITPVDTIGTNLDTAFAVLDIGTGNQDGDVLVTAGGLGDGALFTAPARSSINIVQRLPNWGPVSGCLSIPSEIPEIRRSGEVYQRGQRHRIFVSAGNGDSRGSLNELRHGFEAKVGLDLDCGEMYPRDIFVVPDPAGQAIYVLIAQMVGTTVLRISSLSDDVCAVDGDEIGLNLEKNTIAAGITASNVLTQVTDNGVNLTMLEGFGKRLKHESDLHIVSAEVDAKRELVIIAGNRETGGAVLVEVRRVLPQHGFSMSNEPTSPTLSEPTLGPVALDDQPLSFLVEEVNHRLWLFVGTVTGKLICLSHTSDGVTTEKKEFDVKSPDEGNLHSIEFMQVIRAGHNDTYFILLCGLRCGWIIPYQLGLGEGGSSFSFNPLERWQVGDTSVRLRGYDQDQSFVVLSCGRGLWRLSTSGVEKGHASISIDPIWITDQNNPAYQAPEILASAMISVSGHRGTPNELLNGSLVCCTSDHLLICNLSTVPKMVSRTVFLPGSPEKMVYSPRLNRIVVASLVQEKKLESGHVLSWTRPQLDFIDPDTTNALPFKVQGDEVSHSFVESKIPKLRGAAGERVTALLEWAFKFGEMSYTFIVLATQRPFVADKDSRLRGYLHFLRARFNPTYPEEVESVARHRLAFEWPVRCCCPYGDFGLLVCYGKVARIVVLDQMSRHFSPMPEFSLESEAMSVSTNGHYIFIMTARSSLLVLSEASPKYGELKLVAQAGCDKAGLDHVMFSSRNIILSSHRGGGVVGYYNKRKWAPADKHLPTSFAATMSSSVRYFCGGPCLVADQQEHVHGVGIDGTVYRFTLLRMEDWHLLRFLQNLCMTDRSICSRQNKLVDFWHDATVRRENLQIDGDTLARLCEKGSEYLRQRLSPPPNNGANTHGGGDSDSARSSRSELRLRKRFMELATPVFGEKSKGTDLCEAVVSWARELIHVRC